MPTHQTTVDQYIAAFPEPVRLRLQALRELIARSAPGAEETISYQIPTFRLSGNLVHFAGYKKHIGFYPAPSAISKFSDELEGFRWARGSVQFPNHLPLPLDLVERMVKFRVAEQMARKGT